MFKLTKLVTFMPNAGETERERITAALKDAILLPSHVVRGLVSPTQAHCVNGGDLVWHVQFHDEQAYREAILHPVWKSAENLLATGQVAHVDTVAYAQEDFAVREPGLNNGIYRALLIRLRPSIELEKMRQFEFEMRQMPDYIAAIRNWGFSRVNEGNGDPCWDYVWEQEFVDSNALHGPYIVHPYHFGWIDRWFDPESEDWIVDTQFCHSYCAFTDSMLTPPSFTPAKSTT
jgi:hypothetical protein